MKGFLVLHIMALAAWVGCLIYMPALVASYRGGRYSLEEPAQPFDTLPRLVFTQVATPAGLIAIIAGTAVFVIDINFEPWLIAKLTVVTLLVVLHTLTGLFIVATESGPRKHAMLWSGLLMGGVTLLMLVILWLVLAKPPLEQWL